jgi:hypothetical protein
MPGFHPKKRNEEEPEQMPGEVMPINFSYMTLQSHHESKPTFAMSFEQIISLLDQITDSLDEEEEASAMFHLSQIKRILRTYLRNGH